MSKKMSRRNFLKGAAASGATAAALAGLAGCAPSTSQKDKDASLEGNNIQATDWLGEPPETPDSFSEELEADIIVCGLGIAGISAMRAAAEQGATVIGFDKSDATRSSNQICAFGSSLYASRFPDIAKLWDGSMPMLLNAVSEGCGYRNDIRILRRYLEINGEAIDWYFDAINESEYSFGTSENGNVVDAEADLSLKEAVYPLPEHYDPLNENMPCMPGAFEMGGKLRGSGFLAANLMKAQEEGAEVRTYTPVIKLLQDDDGRVNGIVAQAGDGSYIKALAKKAVIVTTGDFMNNEAMLRQFLPNVLDQGYVPNGEENFYTTLDKDGNPCNTGDGQRMLAWVGGKMQDFPASMSHFSKSANSAVFGTLPYLMLDKNGNRFMNEDAQGQQFAERIRQLPSRTAIMVFDDAFEDQMPWMPYGHGKLPNTTREDVEKRIEEGQLIKADTLEKLFSQLDIDSDTAIASVQRYNKLVEAGQDTDFGKTATRMFPINTPPYYANYMKRGDDLVTMTGICSDENCQVHDAGGNVIEGVLVAGNTQGNRFANIYPETFMGYSVGMAMAFGREAGLRATTL